MPATGDGAPAHGTVTVNGGAITYTPDQFYHGSDSFTVTLSDGEGGTTTQTVNVNVAQVQPVAAPAPLQTTQENSAVTLDETTLGNTVVSGATAAYSVPATGDGAPAHGAVTVNGGAITYTPDQFFHGSDSFTVTVSDGEGGTTTQTVNVNVAQVQPTVSDAANGAITVSEAGQPGLSTSGATTGATISTSATDALTTTVVSGATATVSIATAAQHGTVTYANGALTYVPNAYYTGPDSFVVAVSDGQGGSVNETINVTVAPQAFTDTVAIASNATGTANVYADAAPQLANGDHYVYTVADTQAANAVVSNFNLAAHDLIAASGTTNASQWSYSSDAQGDLIISHTSGGVTESITLDHVITGSAVVYDYASAVAVVGYDFMTFGGSAGASGNNAGITITNGNLNPAGINPNGPAVTTDGSAGNIAYTLNEASATNVAITGFGHGDTIAVSNGSPGDYSFGTANNGHDIVIDHTSNGVTSVVTLVDANPTGAFVDNLATAESVLGYNFMSTAGSGGPSANLAPLSLPTGLVGTTNVPGEIAHATVLNSTGNTNFIDNITTDTAVVINNFASTDQLDFSGGTPGSVSYSTLVNDASGMADLEVSYAVAGHSNIIILHDAVSASAFVYDQASATAAVGHNFVSFA